MAKKTVTIYDVANEAGVSMATVSRVVNRNKNVKPETSKKVQEVIERLNYRPNEIARGLASSRTTTIGVMIPNMTDFYYSTLALGIDDIASMYDYNVILENSRKDSESEASVLNSLLSKQVDGVIYMGLEFDDDIRQRFNQSHTPVVLAGSIDPKNEFPSVNIDYRESTKKASLNLLSKHEKVALVLSNQSAPDGRQRLEGYKEAFDEVVKNYDPSFVYEVEDDYAAAYQFAEELIESGIEAVVTSSDEVGVGIMNRAVELGKSIPDSFEVITSHNTKITEMVRPTLSSIVEPTYDVGAVSMRLLTKLMDEEEIEEKEVILPHNLVHRGTSVE